MDPILNSQINVIRIVWQTVKRITTQILGVKELDAITEYMHQQPKTNKTTIQTQDKIETQK